MNDRNDAVHVLAMLRKPSVHVAAGTTAAASARIAALVARIRLVTDGLLHHNGVFRWPRSKIEIQTDPLPSRSHSCASRRLALGRGNKVQTSSA